MEKYEWNKIGDDFIVYNTVNLNISEVTYLLEVWEKVPRLHGGELDREGGA